MKTVRCDANYCTKNQRSANALMIYYIVEGLKKYGYKPSPELQAFVDNNYKK